MKVHVKYFASVREALGSSESVDVLEGSTLGHVRDVLIATSETHSRVLARGRALRAAVDQVMRPEDTVLSEDAEVAFFPPVTGG
ncbi:MAG: molybdopterin converting factor, subunit 1 [Rhizobacter sp.]|nr:molybdopterin converting factor, subunit 1 [Rhizobacter sp.]